TIDRGAFPRRNPGTSTRPARRRNASSTARSRRSCSTSIASDTWRGGSSVEETFTRALLLATGALRLVVFQTGFSQPTAFDFRTAASLPSPPARPTRLAQPQASATHLVRIVLRSAPRQAMGAADDAPVAWAQSWRS